MNEKITSKGKCIFCKKTYTQRGINRHLKAHLKKMQEAKQDKKESFLLKIDTNPRYGKTPYFLYLWIDGNSKVELIDDYLRKIWLECCGHLSSFVDKERKNNPFSLDFSLENADLYPGEIPMDKKVKDVFHKGQKIEYTYDFGSSTYLLISVEEVYQLKAPEKIVLLSRNEPLKIICEECGKKPATIICSVHYYDENSLFCDKCAKKHAKECDDFEYAALPVVNSPRFGVCAYEGGIIDTERDGIYKGEV